MKQLTLFFAIFSFAFSSYSQVLPQQEQANPAFIEYLNNLEKGIIIKTTSAGYGLGEVPIPVIHNFDKLLPKSNSKFDASYDLRTVNGGNWITSVKNQGNEGACWAFATYGALESYWRKISLPVYDLSEQNLATCHSFDLTPSDGGNYMMSTAYLARRSGPVSEADDPYTLPSNPSCVSGFTPVSYVSESRFLPSKDDAGYSPSVIKQALIDYGALYVNMNFDDNYFNSTDYTYYYNGSASTNHAVLLVGWDDNKVVTGNAATPSSNGAWIIRNSWGPTWGENGFFYLSYEDTKALTSNAFFPSFNEFEPQTEIYSYDKFGQTSSMGYSDGTDYGLIKFVASANQEIEKVGTYAVAASTVIDIEIYDSFDGSNLTTLLGSLTNQTCGLPGYYTFTLSSPISIAVGNDFYVKIKYNTGNDYPVPVESVVTGYTSAAEIQTDKCWISSTGASSSWLAFGLPTDFDYNVCIKAYAKETGGTPVYGVTLLSNPSGIGENLTGDGSYEQGATVSISANAIAGYVFTGWSGSAENLALLDYPNSSYASFTMPNRSVTFVANYQQQVPGPYTINFHITNSLSQPVSNAAITVTPVNVKTSFTEPANYQKDKACPVSPNLKPQAVKSNVSTPFVDNESKAGQWIHWDNGTNTTGIGTNAAANFDVASHWLPADLTAYNGMQISSINFFPMYADCEYILKIWVGTDAVEVYSQTVSNPTIGSWNNISLTAPFLVNASEELWFGLNINTQGGYPAGCDAGPAISGKGDMVRFDSWVSMNNAWSINYNLNLQAFVEETQPMIVYTDENGLATIMLNNGTFDFNIVRDGYEQYPGNFAVAGRGDDFYLTLSDAPSSSVTDIDGNVYPTVTIGTQEWMAKNLRVTHYNNGDPIPTGLDNSTWETTVNGAYAIYPYGEIGLTSEEEVLNAYGALYNWFTINDSRGLCPSGWRIPNNEDWTELFGYMGGASVAGGKLKSTRTEPDAHPRWNSPNTGATDEYSFSALPGGQRDNMGGLGSAGDVGHWWSSSEFDESYAWYNGMNCIISSVFPPNYNDKGAGFSVRCIRNEVPTPEFAGGSGTEIDPWQIATADHLNSVRNYIGGEHSDKFFVQIADIDLGVTPWNEGEGWLPIGNSGQQFFGRFNGNGFSINNLKINRPDLQNVGLFGVAANITNVSLNDVDITGNSCVGAVVGAMGTYCAISNCSSSGIVRGGNIIGGIVGQLYSASISKSYSTCSVIANNGSLQTGGLVGLSRLSQVDNCYATGIVTGSYLVGGLIGSSSDNSTINNSYSCGTVTGLESFGGLIGLLESTTVNDSYWNIETSGQISSAGGEGKNTIEMITQNTFTNWGFDLTWSITEGTTYPYLQWQGAAGEHNYPPVPTFAGGSGTELDPWLVETAEHLNNVKYYLGAEHSEKFFLQVADIDLGVSPWNEGEGWLPIGSATGTPFMGNYNGNNHIISNLTINRPSSAGVGLFGWADGAIISNLGLQNVNILGSIRIGALLGQIRNNGQVNNCYSTGEVSGGNFTAGLVGNLYYGASMSQCFSAVNVQQVVEGSQQAGGLVGRVLTGYISDCYAVGDVSGYYWIGGLAGHVTNASSIANCYSVGAATGESSVGGIVGDLLNSTINNGYWNTETSGITDSPFGEGLTTLEMLAKTSFSNWDFTNIWDNVEGDSYPFLKWQVNPGSYNYPPDLIPPSGLIANLGTGNILLSWNVPSIGTPDGYNIYRDEVLLAYVSGQTSYTDNAELENYNVYNYFVTAVYGAGQSTSSNITSIYYFPGFDGGDGTESNPYQVSNAEQLDAVRYYASLHFIQTAHINLGVTPWNLGEGWQPIDAFKGFYNGQDYTISNLFINRPAYQYQGLFGDIAGATIENLGLTNASVSAFARSAAFVGYSSTSTISNCFVTGTVNGSNNWIGGLVGVNYNHSTVQNCYSTTDVVSTGYSIGSLCGTVEQNSQIINSYSTGSVQGSYYIGGLAGNCIVNSSITGSFSTSTITGTSYLGGIVGYMSAGILNNSYSTGSISTEGLGGGAIGYVSYSTISNIYSTGNVSATEFGGLIGMVENTEPQTSVTNSYWNIETSGQSVSSGGEGKNSQAMITPLTFISWNFTDIWQINEGVTYPYLQWQITPSDFNYPPSYLPATNLTVISGNEMASLNWDAPSIGSPDKYFIYRDDLKVGESTANSFTDNGLTNNTYYTYFVKAVYGVTETDPTNSVQVYVFMGFDGGNGTEENPYLISNAEQLNAVRHFSTSNFKQVANINLGTEPWNVGEGWAPIGTVSAVFTGNYNGDGYSIDNLTINNSEADYVGLFGYVNFGSFSNINLQNVSISANNWVGALVGQLEIGNVLNCYTSGTVSGNYYVGGLAGLKWAGYFENSHSSANVYSLWYAAGGLAGSLEENAIINTSYSTGAISGIHAVGGLVGVIQNGSVVSSYSTSTVSGEYRVGGLVGQTFDGYIEKSYSVGSTSGIDIIGGFVGENSNSSALNCYWNTETSNQTNSALGVGKTTAEMISSSTFEGWSFNSTWFIVEGETYPYLFWQGGLYDFNYPSQKKQVTFNVDMTSALGFDPQNDLVYITGSMFSWAEPGTNPVNQLMSRVNNSMIWRKTLQLEAGSYEYKYFKNSGWNNGEWAGEPNRVVNFDENMETNDLWGLIPTPGFNIAAFNVENQLNESINRAKITVIPNSIKNYLLFNSQFKFGGNAQNSSTDEKEENSSALQLLSKKVDKPNTFEKNDSKGGIWIQWDDNTNFSAVGLGQPEVFYSASRFDVTDLAAYSGMSISQVSVFINGMPTSASIKIWQGTNAFSLNEVVSQAFSPIEFSWNNVFLDETYFINPELELWIGVEIYDPGEVYPMGTDEITNNDGKGNMVKVGLSGDWSNLLGYGIQGDFNIKAFLENGIILYTNEFGKANFNLPNGSYNFLVEKEMYESFADNFTLENNNKAFNVILNNSFAGGDGTQENPFLIENANHLNNVRLYPNAHFLQIASINLGTSPWNEGEGWVPIGNTTSKFKGSYNGDYFTIEGLYINRSTANYQGLFGAVDSASIEGIILSDLNISGQKYVGGFAGHALRSVVSNSMSSGVINGTDYVGGIVGFSHDHQLIKEVYSVSSVNGNKHVGGIAGVHQWYSLITNCYSLGSITGQTNVGGLVGVIAAYGNVSNSYFAGSVSGVTLAGGLVGYVLSVSTVSNSFWDVETSGQTISDGGGEGINTVEMKLLSTYTTSGWDFKGLGIDEIWNISTNGYPFLNWQLPEEPGSQIPVIPTVYTDEIFSITESSAMVKLTITNTGLPKASQFGVCWNTTGEPTIENDKTQEGSVSQAGTFNSLILSVEANTTYYVRAYATNSEGTCYGNELTFIPFVSPIGNGTIENPFLISNLADLFWLTSTQSVWDKYFLQTSNIDASETFTWNNGEGWISIGLAGTPFTGNYNGNGKRINKLYINRPYTDCVGLFGSVSNATISNLAVDDFYVKGQESVGSLTGLMDNSSVEFCSGYGNVIGRSDGVGGLIGTANNSSSISNSYASTSVTGFSGTYGHGGLIGLCNYSSVTNSYSNGTVTSPYAGGLIGGVTESIVENSYWDTQTSSAETSAGGEGRTTDQMTYPYDVNTYVDWDFTNVWRADITETVNNGYPFLKNFYTLLSIEGLTASNKVYDGETNAEISDFGVLSGKLDESHDVQLVTNSAVVSFNNKNVGNNKTVTVTNLSLEGNDAYLYALAPSYTTVASITPKTITSSCNASDKIYDATTIANLYDCEIDGAILGDNVNLQNTATGTFAQAGVGQNIIVTSNFYLDGIDANNYSLQQATSSADIQPKDISVTANSITKAFGTLHEFTGYEFSVSGIIGSDEVTSVTLASDGAGAAAAVGSYDIIPSNALGNGLSNYNISYINGTMSVTNQFELTITGLIASGKVYDGSKVAAITNWGTLQGIQGTDEVYLETTGHTANFISKTVGDAKTVTVSGLTLSGADAGNYFINNQTTTANITSRTLSLTNFSANNKVYDGTANVMGATFNDDRIGGDLLGFTYTASFTDKNVGIGKNVDFTAINLSGSDASNYTLASSVGQTTADITVRTLTLSNIQAEDKEYDGTTDATLTFSDDRILGDDILFSYTANFNSLAAGIGITVTYGSFSISGGADMDNYTLYPSKVDPYAGETTANIAPRDLLLSNFTAADKVYDGTANVSDPAFDDDRIDGDDLEFSYSALFSDKNVGADKNVSFTNIILSGGVSKNNYNLVTNSGSTLASITPAPLTLSGFTAQDKVYDGNTDVTSSSFNDNRISGDNLEFTYAVSFDTKNIGTGKTVSFSGISISGGVDENNYNLQTLTGTASASITPKELTVGGLFTALNKVYNGNVDATFGTNTLSLNGVVTSETVTLSPVITFDSKNVGTNKIVSIANSSSLGGADAGNYTLSLAGVPTSTANIIPKELTVTGSFTVANREYDGTANAIPATNSLSLAGVVTSENVTLSPVLAFDSKSIGTAKVVSLLPTSSIGGTDVGNYTLSLTGAPTATAAITAKTLSVINTIVANKIYDGTTTATISGTTLNGVISGETVTLANNTTASFSQKSVGTDIAVTTSMTLTGADVGNYSIIQPSGLKANITAKELTVTSSAAASKVYDGSTSAIISGATLTGIISPDVTELTNHTTGTFAQENVGTDIAVSTSMSLTGADAGNYSVLQPSGLKANITSKELTVGGTFTVSNKVYDGTASAAIATSSLTLAGVVAGDVVNISPIAAFTDPNVAAGIPVNLTDATTITGADVNNYTLSLVGSPSATASITAKELTIGGTFTAFDKEFDGTTAATIDQNNLTLVGIITGNVVTLANVVAEFAQSTAGVDINVNITSGTLDGADKSNYSLSLTGAPTTTATITVTQTSFAVTFSVVDENGAIAAAVDGSSITSGDEVDSGKDVVFTATPEEGYQVKEWTLNGTPIADNTENAYTLTNLQAVSVVTVEFELIPAETFTLTLEVTPENAGTVSGGGEYEENEQVTVTATANTGFQFLNWRYNGGVISAEETFTYSMPAEDIALVAHFAEETAETYTLTLLANPVEGGTVLGAGDFLEGEVVTIAALPNEGYLFTNWTGAVDEALEATTTFTMPAADVTLTANFEEIVETFTVTFTLTNNLQQPVEDAAVALYGFDEIYYTDENGVVALELVNGDYEFSVTASGYQVASDNFTVNGEDVSIEIELVTVGIETDLLSNLKVYPNPFGNTITLNNAGSVKRVVITNLIGQKVIDVWLKGSENETILTEELVKGIYLIQLHAENGEKVVKKMIKE